MLHKMYTCMCGLSEKANGGVRLLSLCNEGLCDADPSQAHSTEAVLSGYTYIYMFQVYNHEVVITDFNKGKVCLV